MSTKQPTKRFEDWEEVNCNECEHYWTNSCDGVKKGSKIACNSFLATRSIIIPLQIKSLQRAFKWLLAIDVFLFIAMIGILILVL
jgi:hypothetical protein